MIAIMGSLTDPLIARFALRLRDAFGLRTLVETGTYRGVSTRWAAEHFEQVATIDIRGTDHPAAASHCAGLANIAWNIGDSRHVLPPIVADLAEPALFWLDAHAGPGLFGGIDDWPVFVELLTITASPIRHYVLIDDAHCFETGSPYLPTPRLREIGALVHDRGYVATVAHDTIAIVPDAAALLLLEF